MSGRVRTSAARHSGMHDRRHAQAENHLFDKTRMCRFFAQGRCARGLACTFAHSEDELEAKPEFFRTQLCPDFLAYGICPQGSACSFAHGPQELRRPVFHASHPASVAPSRGAQQEALYTEEAHQLELMQEQIARLREQLKELEVLKVGCRASGRGAAAFSSGCSSRDEESAGVCCLAGSFSRQTTAEGETGEGSSSSSTPLTPQSCHYDGETWEHHHAATVEAAETEAPEPCALVVRRTFFSLEPVQPEGARQRSKSAPAAAAPRGGAAVGEAAQ